MRNKKTCKIALAPSQTIEPFGKVRLVKKADGKHEMIGGSLEHHAMVRKWCEKYAPFVIFAEPSGEEVVLAT
jgi:hypothetical protein